ncbi:C-C motif chemokine 22 [Dromiciops gliroides]|uniref:C-C motif chemokine 22 n=1 Tax=Dromiciops gliroides TaxID=33562 RepID=UPI001CC7BA27|nr:C-C motif chemokine 22 [Dromiciops gliroides]
MLYFQAILLVVLLLGTSLQAGPYGVNLEGSVCCNSFVRTPVPFKVLVDFYYTSNSCKKHGVILITRKHREICAEPKKPWVKYALGILEKRK